MEPKQNMAVGRRRQELVASHKKWLVTTGDEIGKKAKTHGEWASQARVIWEAARKETEPLVLLNLLRYQSARNAAAWENVRAPLEEAMEECIKKGGAPEPALELIRHLLVYTIRSYTYHRELAKADKDRRPR